MLTPEEIQSREFLVSLRGYDRDEVHAFLDEVAEAFAQLLADEDGDAGVRTPTPAPAPIEAPEPAPEAAPAPAVETSPFAAIGAETQRILEAAQEAGEQLRRRAQAEAEQARDETLAEARKQVEHLREQAAATQQQIDLLDQRRTDLVERLRQARETVDLAMIELDDEVVEPEPTDPTNSVLAEQEAADVEIVDQALEEDPAETPVDDGPEDLGPVGDDGRAEAAGDEDEPLAAPEPVVTTESDDDAELPFDDVDDEAADPPKGRK